MKKGKFAALLLALLALAAAGTGVWLGFFGQGRSALLLGPAPEPEAAVSGFFTAVCEERYADANAQLSGYATLGLENEPEDENARRIWALIRSGCTWEPSGAAECDGLHARQTISFTAPDASLLLDGIDADVNALLARRVENARRSEEVYNADGGYRREVVLSVYDEALSARLEPSGIPRRSFSVTAELEYQNGAWKIVPSRELLAALCGGLE